MKKRRSGFSAFLLAVMSLGLGHLYLTEARKSLAFVLSPYIIITLVGATGSLSTFYGLVSVAVAVVSIYVFSMIHAVVQAIRVKEISPKWYNRWYFYVLYIVANGFLVNVLIAARADYLGYETFRIPAASMVPTLKIGDMIVVDTKASKHQIGDVIVFLSPDNRKIKYVKRLAALGGDRVEIKNGDVLVNGRVVFELSVHEDLRRREYSSFMNEVVVPEGHIFVIGDYRDNSRDSRFFGTVPIADVTGKVTYIWYAEDHKRIGLKVQ